MRIGLLLVFRLKLCVLSLCVGPSKLDFFFPCIGIHGNKKYLAVEDLKNCMGEG